MTEQMHLPATLEAFLDERLSKFTEKPPPDDWIDSVAGLYKTTMTAVQQAVRSRWRAAPVAPRVVERTPEPASPLDAQHPFDRVLNALWARGGRILPKHDARGREAKRATCPAHDDHNPSLVVTADGPNVLLHCFGGCPTARIVGALGLKLADLFSGPRQPQVRRRRTEVKPVPPPKLSPEERLARKRMLTAARTQRWRERHQTEPVTHPNIRSVTCDAGDAGDAGDAPNVLSTSPVVSIEEDLDLSIEDPQSLSLEKIFSGTEISLPDHRLGDFSPGRRR